MPIGRPTLIPFRSNQFVPKKKKPTESETSAGPGLGSQEPNRNIPRPRRNSTRKKASPPATKKKTAGRKTKSAAPIEPSDNEIRLRAYFISERRRRFAIPGDASSDWLEAKRQLLSEAGQR